MQVNIELNKKYFYTAAEDNGISLSEYFKCLDYNYVIIEGGEPFMWLNGCPIIYGDLQEAKAEIAQTEGGITDLSVITEKEFIGRFCFDEYTEAIKKIAEEEGKDEYARVYELYLKVDGLATFEQFKKAVDFMGLDLKSYNEDNTDSLMAEVSDAFVMMFIDHDESFKKWYNGLDQDTKFDVYGEILGMHTLEIFDLIEDENAYDDKVKELMGGDIMDTLNGHSIELVEKINDAWRKGKKEFEIILKALYERDIDEITDSDAFQITHWVGSWQWNEGCRNNNWEPYMEMALADMKEHWEDYAENYLMHIADDADLESIIAFIHYPYLPIWK